MNIVKQCKYCGNNFDGVCVEDNDVYAYGETISDESVYCDSWIPTCAYGKKIKEVSPRFLIEQLNDCRISYQKFIEYVFDYYDNKDVPINIFDAIKCIYGLSMVDIAVLTNLSFGTVFNAKVNGFTQKRLIEFSNKLFISPINLQKTSTQVFNELARTNSEFWAQKNITEKLFNVPEWKHELIEHITQNFSCPPELSNIFARVDKLFWNRKIPLNHYTESEQAFIQYLSKKYNFVEIDYFLDRACKPHFRGRKAF